MIRKRCEDEGHSWRELVNGFRLPMQPCKRWLCKAERPDPMLPEELRQKLEEVAREYT